MHIYQFVCLKQEQDPEPLRQKHLKDRMNYSGHVIIHREKGTESLLLAWRLLSGVPVLRGRAEAAGVG